LRLPNRYPSQKLKLSLLTTFFFRP